MIQCREKPQSSGMFRLEFVDWTCQWNVSRSRPCDVIAARRHWQSALALLLYPGDDSSLQGRFKLNIQVTELSRCPGLARAAARPASLSGLGARLRLVGRGGPQAPKATARAGIMIVTALALAGPGARPARGV